MLGFCARLNSYDFDIKSEAEPMMKTTCSSPCGGIFGRMLQRAAALALAILLFSLPASASHTRSEVRSVYWALHFEDEPPYAVVPQVTAPYGAGELTASALQEATSYLNFIRWLAGVDPVTNSGIYNYQCQHGAALLSALNYVDHNAPQPSDMDQNFYDSAHLATTSSNIARFNWMRSSIVREGIAYFVRDDGDSNLETLGHRRWALNPVMAATGFGLANASDGMSYVLMYAHDLGNPDADWDRVCWPSEGAFPAELMHDHLAWSVVLNPERYDLGASPVTVRLTEANCGLSFAFRPAEGTGDGFCCLNLEPYGAGGAIIFRPDFSRVDFADYQQNQHWTVRIDHLITGAGEETSLEYDVEMMSLRAQDAVNVEISTTEAELRVGETLRLSASVVPDYADDLSVTWQSDDEAVATVDAQGAVTARSSGTCTITCADSAGHVDGCRLRVK